MTMCCGGDSGRPYTQGQGDNPAAVHPRSRAAKALHRAGWCAPSGSATPSRAGRCAPWWAAPRSRPAASRLLSAGPPGRTRGSPVHAARSGLVFPFPMSLALSLSSASRRELTLRVPALVPRTPHVRSAGRRLVAQKTRGSCKGGGGVSQQLVQRRLPQLQGTEWCGSGTGSPGHLDALKCHRSSCGGKDIGSPGHLGAFRCQRSACGGKDIGHHSPKNPEHPARPHPPYRRHGVGRGRDHSNPKDCACAPKLTHHDPFIPSALCERGSTKRLTS